LVCRCSLSLSPLSFFRFFAAGRPNNVGSWDVSRLLGGGR
jgi:hypothetical protein